MFRHRTDEAVVKNPVGLGNHDHLRLLAAADEKPSVELVVARAQQDLGDDVERAPDP